MHQPLDEQYMLACDRQFVAKQNLKHRRFALLLALLVARLDKRADDGHFDRAYQIGHEEEAVLEDAERNHGLAAIVVGNLASEFADSFLDLVGRDDLAQARVWRKVHSEVRGQIAEVKEQRVAPLQSDLLLLTLSPCHVTSCSQFSNPNCLGGTL